MTQADFDAWTQTELDAVERALERWVPLEAPADGLLACMLVYMHACMPIYLPV